ncbi:flavin monoamine oxidase family protein [Salimicrobium halophilum]|uniref:Monoamine oxidase n=1 Tax=Salimicrobium halophilum TaxID=86666 RepID=A0A1G8UH66_9BACI|nr:FAD-dependent oxidoreductase [Salimicrobium halophilum]SDJ53098.1 monoamine oxidase [Salimicrobium halophilum]
MDNPVVIIGAGLSGLRAASLLAAEGIECRVLEARDRIGGRVMTERVENRPDLGKFDLGPTWFWPAYERKIAEVAEEMKLDTFVQYNQGAMLVERSREEAPAHNMLPADAGMESMRFTGGVQALVDAVATTLPDEMVEFGKRVTRIRMEVDEKITVEAEKDNGEKDSIAASSVILALPPRLAATIEFSPDLPSSLVTGLESKPTWMAGQAKAIAVYDRPFWREEGLSGFAMSWAGPLQEIHDASPEKGSGALFGFFGMPAESRRELGEDEVLKLVENQLVRLFGSRAREMETILYKDWTEDAETAVAADSVPLQDFPVYGPPGDLGTWEKKVYFAGTEADPQFGGHLEGALQAAERVVRDLRR